MFSRIFDLAQRYHLSITFSRCLDDFRKQLKLSTQNFPRESLLSLFLCGQSGIQANGGSTIFNSWLPRQHWSFLFWSTGRMGKHWTSRITEFLSSMRCRNGTYQSCCHPICELHGHSSLRREEEKLWSLLTAQPQLSHHRRKEQILVDTYQSLPCINLYDSLNLSRRTICYIINSVFSLTFRKLETKFSALFL